MGAGRKYTLRGSERMLMPFQGMGSKGIRNKQLDSNGQTSMSQIVLLPCFHYFSGTFLRRGATIAIERFWGDQGLRSLYQLSGHSSGVTKVSVHSQRIAVMKSTRRTPAALFASSQIRYPTMR